MRPIAWWPTGWSRFRRWPSSCARWFTIRARSLEKAFEKLNKDEKLLDDCIEVNRLEDYADLLVRRAVAELFEQEKDPIALIKQKEIYEFLEDTTDRCEDVADVLQNVVVKNS